VESTKKFSILIVEDEREICDVLKNQFEARGASVSYAYDGDEALKKMKQLGAFQALLTDLMMPGNLDGLQLIRKTRELFTDPPEPFLITGYPELDEEEVKRLQISFVFRKPFAATNIFNTIEDHLNKKIKSDPVRRKHRFRKQLSVAILDPLSPIPLTTVDISEGGLFIRMTKPPSEGTNLEIKLEIDRRIFSVGARVIWIKTGTNAGCGVEFTRPSKDLQIALDRALKEQRE